MLKNAGNQKTLNPIDFHQINKTTETFKNIKEMKNTENTKIAQLF